jgi:uncharacterized membrane protein
MEALSAGEAVAGGVLLFFLPGYTIAKALFPERRARGPDGVRWVLEAIAIAFVLSVVLTVTVGYLLLGTPGGFSATWSDPVLEAALAAIALVAFVVGLLEGAYGKAPPVRALGAVEPGSEGAWELSERLDRLQRERLGVERDLRRIPTSDTAAAGPLRLRLDRLLAEEETLRRQREAEYEL